MRRPRFLLLPLFPPRKRQEAQSYGYGGVRRASGGRRGAATVGSALSEGDPLQESGELVYPGGGAGRRAAGRGLLRQRGRRCRWRWGLLCDLLQQVRSRLSRGEHQGGPERQPGAPWRAWWAAHPNTPPPRNVGKNFWNFSSLNRSSPCQLI